MGRATVSCCSPSRRVPTCSRSSRSTPPTSSWTLIPGPTLSVTDERVPGSRHGCRPPPVSHALGPQRGSSEFGRTPTVAYPRGRPRMEGSPATERDVYRSGRPPPYPARAEAGMPWGGTLDRSRRTVSAAPETSCSRHRPPPTLRRPWGPTPPGKAVHRRWKRKRSLSVRPALLPDGPHH